MGFNIEDMVISDDARRLLSQETIDNSRQGFVSMDLNNGIGDGVIRGYRRRNNRAPGHR